MNKWELVYKFHLQPRNFNDFDEMCQYQQDLGVLKHNAISCIQTNEGKIITWGMNLCKKKYIDPYTEEVVSVAKAKTEEEFKEMLNSNMGIKITFSLSTKERDFTGFKEQDFI